MTRILRLPTDSFLPTKKPPYVDVSDLLPIFDKLAYNANLVLVGPKGIGKSMAVNYFAADRHQHIVTFDCSEDIRRGHLIGGFTLQGNESPFVLGPLPIAYEIANETGFCVLDLEEINALSPQMQKLLNSSTDFRRRIEVPECERVFELRPGAKLWVTGSMNTAVYGGVYQLNEDLKSRLRMIPLDYPPREREIVDTALRHSQVTVGDDMIKKVMTIATETRQKAVEYALSPRDVVQILEDIAWIGPERALWVASGKFDDQDRKFFQDRVWTTFGFLLPGATPPAQSKQQPAKS
jgi:MoxR-like ATPase